MECSNYFLCLFSISAMLGMDGVGVRSLQTGAGLLKGRGEKRREEERRGEERRGESRKKRKRSSEKASEESLTGILSLNASKG